CLPILVGCQKNTAPEPDAKLVGKWKLVKGVTYSSITKETHVEDYSDSQTIYTFDADGNFEVNSEMEDKFRFKSGKYTYQLNESSNDQKRQFGNVTVSERTYHMTCSSAEMTIGMNPIDPLGLYESSVTAYFVRTQ